MKKMMLPLLLVSSIIAFTSTTCNKDKCVANPKPDCMCTAQYDPVCGCDGKTYGNACEAACAGVDVVRPGECK